MNKDLTKLIIDNIEKVECNISTIRKITGNKKINRGWVASQYRKIKGENFKEYLICGKRVKDIVKNSSIKVVDINSKFWNLLWWKCPNYIPTVLVDNCLSYVKKNEVVTSDDHKMVREIFQYMINQVKVSIQEKIKI